MVCTPLGSKVKALRTEKGMNLSELARKSGHPVSTIHGIESGANKNPRLKIMRDISKVLGCCLDDFKNEI